MKYLGILAIGTLAAACGSNSPPPAATAASVDAASSTPSSYSDGAPVSADAALATASDDHSAAAGGAGTKTARPAPVAPADSPTPGMTASNAAATPAPNSGAPAPDNTRVNARDRDSQALTPMDQGGSEQDRKITQQIRQAVMKDGSLSFTAKNVKIITINGKVTLRGPVKTDAERAAIEAAAKSAVGAGQVDNLIEVKK